jgi:glycosyltransferase involved in cell wall biosynthesis
MNFANSQPLVSLYLVSFNQEKYIEKAVRSALSQTYSNLEIVISDDCSLDQTYQIIKNITNSYSGRHKITINRNATNLGLIRHVNSHINICHGELIVGMAGDDISHCERVAKLVQAYISSGRTIDALCSKVAIVDENDSLLGYVGLPETKNAPIDPIRYAEGWFCHVGASQAWTRRLFVEGGKLAEDACVEDVLIGFRAGLMGGMLYVPEVLLDYRTHGSNINSVKLAGKFGSAAKGHRRNAIRWHGAISALRGEFLRAQSAGRMNPRKSNTIEMAIQTSERRASIEAKLWGGSLSENIATIYKSKNVLRPKILVKLVFIYILPASLYGIVVWILPAWGKVLKLGRNKAGSRLP